MSEVSSNSREWWVERNARRRERYAGDANYAENRRRNRREAYRKNLSEEHRQSLEEDCEANLKAFDNSGGDGIVRLVQGSPTKVEGHVFTQEETAKLFNRNGQIVSRWRSRELFPNPFLEDEDGVRYYADVEVREFIRIIAEHQRRTLHFRKEHVETIQALREASFAHNMDKARSWIEAHRKSAA